MTLGHVLHILSEKNEDMDCVYINGHKWSEIDFTNSDMLALVEVPVYHYFINGDGTILVDTMWS